MDPIENEIVEDMLELGFTPYQIKLALEDGDWLEAANISQAEAEDAHAVVVARIKELEMLIIKNTH